MALAPTIQERAFQLARELPTVALIRAALVREGYDSVDAQLSAYSFRLALKRLARANRKPAVAEASESLCAISTTGPSTNSPEANQAPTAGRDELEVGGYQSPAAPFEDADTPRTTPVLDERAGDLLDD